MKSKGILDNVWIIIVTYNGKEWIDRCLQSCGNNKVVVVDNNSTDDTVDFIRKNYSNVHIVKQAKNLGFGQANNIGISYALNHGAKHVFLLNQDAYLVNDCLDNLIEVQKKNNEFGILSPVHLNGQGTRLDFNFSSYIFKNRDFYSDHVLGKLLKNIYELPFVNAAGWLVSRECLKRVGGFDPMFFHYGEDDNYCHRVIYHGFKIGVVPNEFLKHDRAQINNKQTDTLILKERVYKVEYGNPDRDNFEKQFPKKINLLRRAILKNKLMLRSGKYKQLNEYLKMLVRIQKEIAQSRKTIALSSTPFLNIDE